MSLAVTLTARSELRLGAGPQSGSHRAGHDHVPGSVLRGALASRWIAEHGLPVPGNPRRSKFLELFEGTVAYGPCLPEGTFIEPLSVLRCKYRPQPHCQTTWIDQASPNSTTNTACQVCGGVLASGRGGLTHSPAHRRTRTALNAATTSVDGTTYYPETAAEGSLFSEDRLPVGTILHGSIVGASDAAANWLRNQQVVYVGGSRSTSGHCDVNLDAGAPSVAPARADGAIAVVLQSPAIFVDNATRPMLDPTRIDWSAEFDCPVRLQRHWSRVATVGGWHAASGLPKPPDRALAAGTVLLFEAGSIPDARQAIRRRPVGLRGAEGYGFLAVDVAARPQAIQGSAPSAAPDLRRRVTSTLASPRHLNARDRQWLAGVLSETATRRFTDPSYRPLLERRARLARLQNRTRELIFWILDNCDADELHKAANEIEVGQ